MVKQQIYPLWQQAHSSYLISDAPFSNQCQIWLNQDDDDDDVQIVTEHFSWGGASSHQAFKEDDDADLLLSQSGKKVPC